MNEYQAKLLIELMERLVVSVDKITTQLEIANSYQVVWEAGDSEIREFQQEIV